MVVRRVLCCRPVVKTTVTTIIYNADDCTIQMRSKQCEHVKVDINTTIGNSRKRQKGHRPWLPPGEPAENAECKEVQDEATRQRLDKKTTSA